MRAIDQLTEDDLMLAESYISKNHYASAAALKILAAVRADRAAGERRIAVLPAVVADLRTRLANGTAGMWTEWSGSVRSLLEFVEGGEQPDWSQQIMDRLKKLGDLYSFDFCCDGSWSVTDGRSSEVLSSDFGPGLTPQERLAAAIPAMNAEIARRTPTARERTDLARKALDDAYAVWQEAKDGGRQQAISVARTALDVALVGLQRAIAAEVQETRE